MAIYRDDADHTKFLELLTRVVEEKQVVCHAHCLMTNHYHLVATTRAPNLSNTVRQLNGEYARWWNHRHGHVGHVFQGRFKAQVVQDDRYLLTVCRYVVLNPVRAGLVELPEQWAWSSYRATAGLAPVPAFLCPQSVWQYMGPEGEATLLYRQYVSAAEPGAQLPPCSVLGDDEFQWRFKAWRESASREVPASERAVRPSLDALFARAVTRSARNEAVAQARTAGYRIREIARYLDVHESTITRMADLAARGQGRELLRTRT